MLTGSSQFPDVKIQPAPERVVTQCLKPALDGRGLILRLWEVTGSSDPIPLALSGFAKVTACDLLERDGAELPLTDDVAQIPTRGWGFSAVRLE
jgi:alpha-mannosidase